MSKQAGNLRGLTWATGRIEGPDQPVLGAGRVYRPGSLDLFQPAPPLTDPPNLSAATRVPYKHKCCMFGKTPGTSDWQRTRLSRSLGIFFTKIGKKENPILTKIDDFVEISCFFF